MELAVKTCTLDIPFTDMLDFCAAQNIRAVEIGTGNWSSAPHMDLDAMLGSEAVRAAWMDELRRRNIRLCALNCSGNPLAYEADRIVTEKTFRLASLLGVDTIVMMSGLPTGCPWDKTPVWITTSWPPETQEILDYQWNQVAIPTWREFVRMAKDCGIRRIALENHGMQLVYNPETLLRLREAVGPIVGMNLDPSHLFWMGGDPIEAARVLGETGAIYHVHGKDSRPERRMCGPNGMLDTKPIDQFRRRAWNYVAVGSGHGVEWWKEFFSVLRMEGYDGVISLEMEDLTMPMLEGHLSSISVLKEALTLV
ncbi:MAG: sugar phosphate isomerase/epimerase [Oscillibacter sp.]|nr:sugar phosphate isomerase/epimerase [Oscillibacter sp.]